MSALRRYALELPDEVLEIHFGLLRSEIVRDGLCGSMHALMHGRFVWTCACLCNTPQAPNACQTESQVWTYASRVAFVLSVTAKGAPIQDGIKLQRLQQLLLVMMSLDGRGTVNIHKVRCGPARLPRPPSALLVLQTQQHCPFHALPFCCPLTRPEGACVSVGL